jgi:hypothetical protein
VLIARIAADSGLLLTCWDGDRGRGIKDVMSRSTSGPQFESYIGVTEPDQRLVAVEPSYARELLRDVASWTRSTGIAPHPDFVAVEQLFGDVDADACDATFDFLPPAQRRVA